MRELVAAACGAGVGLGLLLVLNGLRREPRLTSASAQPRTTRLVKFAVGRGPVRIAGALAAVAVVAVTTRWLVAGVVAGIAVWTLPRTLRGAERARAQRVAQLDALATWTESLTATLSAAAGLEQALIATTRNGPAAIRAALTGLGEALQHGATAQEALTAFAQDLDDPVADTVVATLLHTATHGGARLSEPLGVLAAATRQEVIARRQVETSRARVATDVRLVIAVATLVITVLVVANRGFLSPYDTLTGQLVLAVIAAVALGALRWLDLLARHDEPTRVVLLSDSSQPRTRTEVVR